MKCSTVISFTTVFAFLSLNVAAQETLSDNDTVRKWTLPSHVSMQFAGNIGLISVGVGYNAFKSKCQLTLAYGYVPAPVSRKAIQLITLKGNITLFKLTIRKHQVLPYFGLAGTMETGRNTFIRLPSRYPRGYYHSNAFHLSGALGLKTSVWHSGSPAWLREIEVFSEVGSQEIFIFYKVTQNEIDLGRILNVAVGVNLLLP